MLTFRIPTQNDCQEVLAYRTEILRCTESFDGAAGLGEFERFSAWLERLELLAPGRAEKYGYYPTLVRLAYEDDRLAGILNVRVTEDAFVRTYAGHIGYNVRPSCRRNGYGLACALEAVRICAENGIVHPVICTNPENRASQKTAEAAGFVFAGKETTRSGITVLRYVR